MYGKGRKGGIGHLQEALIYRRLKVEKHEAHEGRGEVKLTLIDQDWRELEKTNQIRFSLEPAIAGRSHDRIGYYTEGSIPQ